jgi:hypothetical protein
MVRFIGAAKPHILDTLQLVAGQLGLIWCIVNRDSEFVERTMGRFVTQCHAFQCCQVALYPLTDLLQDILPFLNIFD